jgi:hypothetical protein
MKTRGTIHKLTNSTARLDASDSGRLINPQTICPLFVCVYSNLSEGFKYRKLADKSEIIADTSEADSEKTFFITCVLPFLSQVFEIGEGGLDGPQDSCNSHFSCKAGDCVCSSDNNLCEITELERPKNDFGAWVSPKIIIWITSPISSCNALTCCSAEESGFS